MVKTVFTRSCHRVLLLSLVCLAQGAPLRADHIANYAVARTKVPGEPEYGDITMTGLRRRPSAGPGGWDWAYNTFQWMDTFNADGLYHVYARGDVGFVEDVVLSGRAFVGALTGTGMNDTPGDPNHTQLIARDKKLDGTLNESIDVPEHIYGDLASPTYRDIVLSHMKVIVDGGGRGVSWDFPRAGWRDIIENTEGGYGDASVAAFAVYLDSNGFAGQHGLPADLTGFNYRSWVNGIGGEPSVPAPVRTAFETFHEEMLIDFHSTLKSEINAYAQANYGVSNIAFTMNNYSGIYQSEDTPWQHPAFEFWLGEVSVQFGDVIAKGPGDLYSKIKNAESLGRFQMFHGTSDPEDEFPTDPTAAREGYLSVVRDTYTTAYASGSIMSVPWDKWRIDSPRFFANYAEFGDLTDMIHDNRHLYDDHEEVFAVGGSMAAVRAPGLTVDAVKLVGADTDTLLTVRAVPDNALAPSVVHLVDYATDPNTNTHVGNSPFSVELHNDTFGWDPGVAMAVELLLPGPDGTVQTPLAGTLVGGGYTSFSIPALDPYGILVVGPYGSPDFDQNGIVAPNDFMIWQRGVGLTGQTDNSNGDANGDGTVDGADLAIWKDYLGGVASVAMPASSSAVTVPEPASILLAIFASGLVGCLFGSRARSRVLALGLVVAIASLADSAHADVAWLGGFSGDNWNAAANWDGGALPEGPTHSALIGDGDNPQITSSLTINPRNIIVDGGTIDHSAGLVDTISGGLNLGGNFDPDGWGSTYNLSGTGEVRIDAANFTGINIGWLLYSGQSTLNISGNGFLNQPTVFGDRGIAIGLNANGMLSLKDNARVFTAGYLRNGLGDVAGTSDVGILSVHGGNVQIDVGDRFEQDSISFLDLHIDGTGISPINTRKNALLDGMLQVDFATPPSIGSSYTIINTDTGGSVGDGGVSGTFAFGGVTATGLAAGQSVYVDYGDGSSSASVSVVVRPSLGGYDLTRGTSSFYASQEEATAGVRTWLPDLTASNVVANVNLSDLRIGAVHAVTDGPDMGLVVPGVRSSLSDSSGTLTSPRGSVLLNTGAGADWDSDSSATAIANGHYVEFTVSAESGLQLENYGVQFDYRLEYLAWAETPPTSFSLFADTDEDPLNGQTLVGTYSGMEINSVVGSRWHSVTADAVGDTIGNTEKVLRLVFFGGDNNGEGVSARLDNIQLVGELVGTGAVALIPEPSAKLLMMIATWGTLALRRPRRQ